MQDGLDPAALGDTALLELMRDHDYFEWELFGKAYGIDAGKPLAAYRTSKKLPDHLRSICLELLGSSRRVKILPPAPEVALGPALPA